MAAKNKKPRITVTAKDFTGEKYNTYVKENAAKLRSDLAGSKRKPTAAEKALLGADEAIRKMNKSKKVSPLDDAISKGKTLPSKNKRYPGDSDVKMGPSKGRPVIRPNAKPAPLAKAPAKIKGTATPAPLPKKPSNLKSNGRTIATKKPAKKK